jgi:hypothetical protein
MDLNFLRNELKVDESKLSIPLDTGYFVHIIFIRAFGRRRGTVVQYIVDKCIDSIKNNQLIDGYAFVPIDEIGKETVIPKNTLARETINYMISEKVLSVQSFGTDEKQFFKVNFKKLFKEFIPKGIEHQEKILAEAREKEKNRIPLEIK